MGKIRVDEITDELGTGSPSFPNGVAVNQITNEAGDGPPEFPNGIAVSVITDEAGTGNPSFPNGVPAQSGQISFFAMNTAPTGWLKANGAAISRTTYSALFDAIGTTFGAGDGSTTFALPDMRGEFPRGWDDGRGVDSGRSFGSGQSDGIKQHDHQLTLGNGGSGAFGFLSWGSSQNNATANGTLAAFGAVRSQSRTGDSLINETRSRNIALLACIKF